MARNESPPFQRGSTYFGGGTVDATSGANFEGKTWLFEDTNPSTGVSRTNRYVLCRCVRNVSNIALLPRRLARFKTLTGVTFHAQVDGYTTTTAARGYPIDEYLPAAGVPHNDLFYIVVEGPALCLTDLAQTDDINVGDKVVALTAVTSQATTAGRLDLFDATGATLPLANQIMHYVGHALSAITSGNTNASLLVCVGKW